MGFLMAILVGGAVAFVAFQIIKKKNPELADKIEDRVEDVVQDIKDKVDDVLNKDDKK
jgi:divalent metal cation (Fe/Co/Zn/Cd) transporter